MQLDQLQLELRPRPHPQALDLGMVLLRSRLGETYKAWLALWLPLVGACACLAWLFPGAGGLFLLLAWWLKPLLERAPLYLLSRQVFGETPGWRDALRAWPGQLRGGWFRLLTWWRPFVPERGLYQAIWQLEGARGEAAAERRRIIGGDKTSRAAFWFGIMCAHFEMILQLGLLAFVGLFLGKEKSMNPFAYLLGGGASDSSWILLAEFGGYAIAGGLIGPIYVACCFTLYLNRRATMEAWDIEIVLRQIASPAGEKKKNDPTITRLLAMTVLPALFVLPALLQPAPVAAATSGAAASCAPPDWVRERKERQAKWSEPAQDAQQAALRAEVAELFASEELRGYACEKTWQPKNAATPSPRTPMEPLPDLSTLALAIRIMLITLALGVTGWLLYRYRDRLSFLADARKPYRATEIAGMDIRPDTLPDDVAGAVRGMWLTGDNKDKRAALALLYRATLSRLVQDHRLPVTRGATEADCLRTAGKALAEKTLPESRYRLAAITTDMWLKAAYGNRWPDDATLSSACQQWQADFGNGVLRREASP
jgi:hypothetical protein